MGNVDSSRVIIPRIPEPEIERKMLRELLEDNPLQGDYTIRQATWFTTPYYKIFKKELSSKGISWQLLMEATRLVQYHLIQWVLGKEKWENVMTCLEEAINYLKKIKGK